MPITALIPTLDAPLPARASTREAPTDSPKALFQQFLLPKKSSNASPLSQHKTDKRLSKENLKPHLSTKAESSTTPPLKESKDFSAINTVKAFATEEPPSNSSSASSLSPAEAHEASSSHEEIEQVFKEDQQEEEDLAKETLALLSQVLIEYPSSTPDENHPPIAAHASSQQTLEKELDPTPSSASKTLSQEESGIFSTDKQITSFETLPPSEASIEKTFLHHTPEALSDLKDIQAEVIAEKPLPPNALPLAQKGEDKDRLTASDLADTSQEGYGEAGTLVEQGILSDKGLSSASTADAPSEQEFKDMLSQGESSQSEMLTTGEQASPDFPNAPTMAFSSIASIKGAEALQVSSLHEQPKVMMPNLDLASQDPQIIRLSLSSEGTGPVDIALKPKQGEVDIRADASLVANLEKNASLLAEALEGTGFTQFSFSDFRGSHQDFRHQSFQDTPYAPGTADPSSLSLQPEEVRLRTTQTNSRYIDLDA